jgi:hypothetical protein
MTRRSTLRLLRIAFSAGCGIVCLLLVVLCVRSYGRVDEAIGQLFNRGCSIGSSGGRISVHIGSDLAGYPGGWRTQSYSGLKMYGNRDFYLIATPSLTKIGFPYWLLVVAPVMAALIPWIRWPAWNWQFSLRTLLIATTLVAVALGLIIVFRR